MTKQQTSIQLQQNPSSTVPRGGLLQRQCAACGQRTQTQGECSECGKKRPLQRRAVNSAEVEEIPEIVHTVLNSPGESLSPTTRLLMESRFDQDFSQVRIHTDAQAAESARSVNALAYTVGRDLVFASGQYSPTSPPGQTLLAHELSHVVQQGNRSVDSGALQIQPGDATAEAEADRAAQQVMNDPPLTPNATSPTPPNFPLARGGAVGGGVSSVAAILSNGIRLSSGTDAQLMRRLAVEHPIDPIPNPGGNGLVQTNAETIEQYLQQLSSEGSPVVDPGTGQVSMSNPEFCQHRGFWNRLGRGIASGFVRGAEIGAYFLGVGAIPGSILGALIGGVTGIFGSDSQAEESSTPTGSTCICDFINSPNLWTIRIDDTDTPLTGDTFVRVNSPNSPRIYGTATVSGRLENAQPWLALGHELCGHAWLQERHQEEGEEPGERHHRTVERENLIRQEHGLEARGFRLRDPYCGESFYRDRATPQGTPHWQRVYDERNQQAIREGRLPGLDPNRTYLDECREMRQQYLGDRARRYRVDERIP